MRREGIVKTLLSLLALTSLLHFIFHFWNLPDSQYLQLSLQQETELTGSKTE